MAIEPFNGSMHFERRIGSVPRVQGELVTEGTPRIRVDRESLTPVQSVDSKDEIGDATHTTDQTHIDLVKNPVSGSGFAESGNARLGIPHWEAVQDELIYEDSYSIHTYPQNRL
jgi:hypothetical protein